MNTELGILYTAAEWPHGLRCSECQREFHDGERFSQRLQSYGTNEDDSMRAFISIIVCVPCALGPEPA